MVFDAHRECYSSLKLHTNQRSLVYRRLQPISAKSWSMPASFRGQNLRDSQCALLRGISLTDWRIIQPLMLVSDLPIAELTLAHL
eukprot:s88_g30.t1